MGNAEEEKEDSMSRKEDNRVMLHFSAAVPLKNTEIIHVHTGPA